jgi:hypothetical protein
MDSPIFFADIYLQKILTLTHVAEVHVDGRLLPGDGELVGGVELRRQPRAPQEPFEPVDGGLRDPAVHQVDETHPGLCVLFLSTGGAEGWPCALRLEYFELKFAKFSRFFQKKIFTES